MDHQVLLDFEAARKINALALGQFANRTETRANINLRLELIALDIEIRLKLGDSVCLDQYILEFPGLAARIPGVYHEVKKDFQQTFCPVKDKTGQTKFPCEFEHFTVHQEIGRGGMGVVYRATNNLVGDDVALKVLFLKRNEVIREAKVLAKLSHSRICQVKEISELDELPYVALELIEGENLKSLLKREKLLSALNAAKIAAQIACGLAHAHSKGIVHFDIKPSNILVVKQYMTTLTDFGLATEIEKFNELEKNSGSASIYGSPAYMAPEFFSSYFGTPGISNDIYGLGIVLYEMLTGTVPFHGSSKSLVVQICHHPAPRPRDFPLCDANSELEFICLKALNKHAAQRYQSMGEFHEALLGWIETQRSGT